MDAIWGHVMRWLAIIFFCLCISCRKEESPANQSNIATSTSLSIYALQELRSSGLESAVVPEFEKTNSCKVELTLFSDPPSLIDGLKNAGDSVDVVLGIPSSFTFTDSLSSLLMPYIPEAIKDLNPDCIQEKSHILTPYGFSYIGLLYNKNVLEQVPASFGELQDERYLNQLAVVDPRKNAASRAVFHWFLALFGDSGYQQMLRALRKNVYRNFSSEAEALRSVISGESSMMLGLITLSAWQSELQQEEGALGFKLFDEGSYQYSECVGVAANSQNKVLASAFVDYLLSPAAQKMVVYKLGMFPANRNSILPPSFTKVPISPWFVNDKLANDVIRENSSEWLQSWDRIFGID
jgi:ABC transporter substrate-binding protein (ThiB subfamily)